MEDESKKQFVCRSCAIFLDSEDLQEGKCPQCGEDDSIFENDLLNED